MIFSVETVDTGCFKKAYRRKAFTVGHYRFVTYIKKLLPKKRCVFSFVRNVRNQLLIQTKNLFVLSISFSAATRVFDCICLQRNPVRMCFLAHTIITILFNNG